MEVVEVAVVEVVVMVQTIQLAVLELQILAVEAALQAIREHQILPLVALAALALSYLKPARNTPRPSLVV